MIDLAARRWSSEWRSGCWSWYLSRCTAGRTRANPISSASMCTRHFEVMGELLTKAYVNLDPGERREDKLMPFKKERRLRGRVSVRSSHRWRRILKVKSSEWDCSSWIWTELFRLYERVKSGAGNIGEFPKFSYILRLDSLDTSEL